MKRRIAFKKKTYADKETQIKAKSRTKKAEQRAEEKPEGREKGEMMEQMRRWVQVMKKEVQKER